MEIVKIIIKVILIIYEVFLGICFLLAIYYNIWKGDKNDTK